MRTWRGVIREIWLGPNGREAWLECPVSAIPAPGQYLLGWLLGETEAPLAVSLFPAEIRAAAFRIAAPVSPSWEPGVDVLLRGPLGHGFHLPPGCQRAGLVAWGETAGRLLALLPRLLESGCSVVLCAECPLPLLPPEVEIYPLEGLAEVTSWADFLAFDLPMSLLPRLRELDAGCPLPPGQALLHTALPCGGLGECGACAVPGLRRPKLACKDGPVFSLRELVG